MISDSSGNERRNIMSFLMPQSLDNQGSMFYLDSINSVDDVERFLGDYHAAKNRILFLKNWNNESTDQAPTINDQIEMYLLRYMREYELGCMKRVSDKIEKSMLEHAVQCVVSILRFSQKHWHTLQIICKKSYNNPLMDLIKVCIITSLKK